MKLEDSIIKKEWGFSESFAQKMTSAKDRRLQLFDMDLFDYVNQQCLEKCGIEPSTDIEQGATCDDCHCDCPIIYFNLAVIKLGMLENAIKKIEITGENIEVKVVKDNE